MKDHARHGRKSNWTAQLSPYLKNLKIKSFMQSPKSPKSPKSPDSSTSPRSPRRQDSMDESSFQIIHTPDRPERPVSRTAIPNDEQCMQFLMSLQRQEEHKRGGVKHGLKMWPYPDEVEETRRLRSVRVESVHLEEARLARTNSSGPAKVVEVGRSSTKSTTATRRSGHLPSPSVSDGEEADVHEVEEDEDVEPEPKTTVRMVPLSPPPTLSRSQSRLGQYTPRAQTSRWSDDSESLFSSRDVDSPCPVRGTFRSSAEVSSPTMVDDDSAGPSSPSSPPLLTPVKDRPATPFTDPRLRSVSDPTTPPPSDHIVHQMSPESLPRKYSWRSSKETILNTGAPVSRFQSWLPEPRPKSSMREVESAQEQKPEIEIYGDWADYYFEDGNFWDEVDSDADGNGDEEADDEEKHHSGDEGPGDDEAEEAEEQVDGEGEDDEEEEEEDEQKTNHLEVDDEKVYPRYESFIKDYKNNVMNITVTEYVLGSQPFGRLDIRCRPGVLVPRAETEAYVMHLGAMIRGGELPLNQSGDVRVVDFCTGTGCIALGLYDALSKTERMVDVIGIDVSEVAVNLSRENLKRNVDRGVLVPPADRKSIAFRREDVFNDAAMRTIPPCDVLVSNPPYISSSVWTYGRGQMGYSVRKYEPKLALVPGAGLPVYDDCNHADVFYARLLDVADWLKSKILLFEVGDLEQAVRVVRLVRRKNHTRLAKCELWRDWPDLSSEEDEAPELEMDGEDISVKGSGNVRSVFVRI
ncbi:Mitochondrial N(5)-glutamine methyltransferase MTQ1 [Colletotrichum fructicola]|nr:Mitochondrial N(5)-glutamine methyltransferase MTQ1 [Colletotrichum fructicola]